MTTVSLIYAYWPNQPGGATWCDLPWAMRGRELPKRLSAAGHNVLETMLMAEEPTPEDMTAGLRLAAEISDAVREAKTKAEFAVVLAGSCALAAIGAVGGLGGDTQIAWFDAHPDLSTPETSTSGLFEGMALAAATGNAWRAFIAKEAKLSNPPALEKVAMFGVRDIEPAEKAVIDAIGLPVTREPVALAKEFDGSTAVYAHLDMDVHDALDVRVNSPSVAGGMTSGEVKAALMALPRLDCLSITGLDPAAPDASRALDIAIECVLSLAAERR